MEKTKIVIMGDASPGIVHDRLIKLLGEQGMEIISLDDVELFIKADTTIADLPPKLTTMNIFHPPLTRAERRKQARKK